MNECDGERAYMYMKEFVWWSWCQWACVRVSVCACVTHMPAVERLLGNPSKKDLELVGSRAGQCGTEGEAKGEERWVCHWTKTGQGWINPVIRPALSPGAGNFLNHWLRAWVKSCKPSFLHHLSETALHSISLHQCLVDTLVGNSAPEGTFNFKAFGQLHVLYNHLPA